jgi:hypothetical protein
MQEAKGLLQPYTNPPRAMELQWMKMYTSEAALKIPDRSIFVDARHDYCGTSEDLNTWWPKLRGNGILAGHDYLTAAEARPQDWSKCHDGSVHEGAVKGAVDDFATKHGLTVTVTWQEPMWSTWVMRKPSDNPCPPDQGKSPEPAPTVVEITQAYSETNPPA